MSAEREDINNTLRLDLINSEKKKNLPFGWKMDKTKTGQIAKIQSQFGSVSGWNDVADI